MKLVKTIHAASGHTIAIFAITELTNLHPAGDKYTHYYEARNFDENGPIFFYLAKGFKGASKQIMVWYRNKKAWCSYGNSFEEAINGAQRDGWLYAD